MKAICLLVIAALVLACAGCTKKTEVEGIHNYSELKALFNNPPSEYRSAPLWDWNDQISREGIDFQLNEFKKAGIGGVFVHPRPGLITEYLSDEWFQLFDYTIQKGKELDMKVWIYDENSYPSGFAGGHVPAQMPDSYRHGTGLKLEIHESLNIVFSDTIEVVLKKSEHGFEDVTSSFEMEKGKTGLYYIFRKTYPHKSEWYGGFTYVDLLQDGVTEKFIEITMTNGYERNIADFGKTLPGIFTDEPNLEAAISDNAMMRWTPGLWDAFRSRWGYDLKTNLPSLVEETGEWKKIRHDYYELLLELFLEKWAKPWSRYCEENGLKWTGHYWEHGWPEPTDGFDEAAFYIYHQQPGIDMLGNRLDTCGLGGQFGNDRAVRELASAANQAGRTRTLSETYGGGGWEMSFETQKRLLDWECVLGVNFVNQHLSYYSIKGVRKFDYPPSFSYHEPWWENYRLMGDYTGRVCMALASGKQINTTLVLQPNTTAWMYFSRNEKHPAIDSIRTGFKKLIYNLEQKQYEYDLGSEYVIKTLGRIEKGNLVVGQRSYGLVIIPAEMQNIDKSTFDLLSQYLEAGGKILSFADAIPYLDGDPSILVNELSAKYPSQWISAETLDDPEAIKLLSNEDFSLTDLTKNGMLYHQRRTLNDGQLLFIVNSHTEKNAKADISVNGKYVSRLDLFSGEIKNYPVTEAEGKVSFHIELEPVGSALFAVTDKNPSESEFHFDTKNEHPVESNKPVSVQREKDNILMINYLDLKTEESSKENVYFMEALIGLFKEKGIEMGNPWQHKIQYKTDYLALDSLFTEDSGFEAVYHFNVAENIDQQSLASVKAVVERPELWSVSINGKTVERIPGAFWIDRDFPVFSIGEFVRPGKNTIRLKASRMNILAEIMPVYILGDFLVKPCDKGFEISGGTIDGTGSWINAGLPFYPHKVAYSREYSIKTEPHQQYKIRLNKWNGTLAEVLVNGNPAGVIFRKPYDIDITPFITNGINKIEVKVCGSLKNTFGFFYEKNDNWIFGPHSWNNAPAKIPGANEYFLIDYGLFEDFELLTTE